MKRNIGKGIWILLLGMLLAAAVFFVSGIRLAYVKSGSMEPAIHVGSLCLIDVNVQIQEIEEADVIVFSVGKDRNLVIHRVVKITAKGFQTKGDANRRKDPWKVSFHHVQGKVIGSVPYAGYAAAFFQSEKGLSLMLGAGLLYGGIRFCKRKKTEKTNSIV